MSHFQDERDFEEEAANAALLREDERELADYEIEPDDGARTYTEDDRGNWHEVHPPVIQPRPQDEDSDLTADAMKTLEDRILAVVPDGQRDEVQDWISDLLDLAPGQALSPEATRDAARHVLEAQALTVSDWEVNAYAVFRPYVPAEQNEGAAAMPAIEIGGNEDGAGAVQVYVYRENGRLVISPHFDTAEGGPWAFYGPDGAVPVTVLGGTGEPVYVADKSTPDLSDALTTNAHGTLRWLAEVTEPDDIDHEAVIAVAHSLASSLRDLLAITGRPFQPASPAEGGSEVQGGSA